MPRSSAALTAVPAPRTRRGRTAAVTAPLGSLTQAEHRSGATCAACGSTRVTQLGMQLTDGTPVLFTSCRRCEHRRWEHEGSALSMETVLERTRKTA
jgi:DNA-directed RNA polymerase subunit M/transcription elongation factor TFIIS